MTLVGISGSLRTASWNTQLIEAILPLVPSEIATTRVSLAELPLFNEDLEMALPASVLRFKAVVTAADGLIVSTPEYNLGIPGVLKNAFDWLSRPPAEQLPKLQGKPVLLMGTTPGPFGTISAQSACLQMFRALQMPVCPGLLAIPFAHESIGDGEIRNHELRARLKAQIDQFLVMFARIEA